MKQSIIILGSTGSVGSSTLKVLKKNKNFKVKLLSTSKNINKVYTQAIQHNVKNIIIENKDIYKKNITKFQKKGIKLHLGFKNFSKILNIKVDYCINSISGINGLNPTLLSIPHAKNILIANKESIICGWQLISKQLIKYKTNFIPIDSEHYSIWKLLNNEDKLSIEKIILTASGGPFLNKKVNLAKIKPEKALKHPNWKMGKKISIDSATMMNKVFEFIEAKKIFNIKNKDLNILIHPSSYVHAIIYFKGGLIKFLAHETSMTIPISNALNIKDIKKKFNIKKNVSKLNKMNFQIPSKKKFPVLSVLNNLPEKDSFFETILITINDELVKKYLNNEINYKTLQTNLINLMKHTFFNKYYKLKPNNVYDIKNMVKITKKYLNNKLIIYE